MDRTSDVGFWEEYFAAYPDVLHQLLGDLYTITKAHQNPVRRGGRRPDRTGGGSLDELWTMLTPVYSVKPFTEAIKDLPHRSLRHLAEASGFSLGQLHRLVTGQRPIVMLHDPKGSLRRLELIAAALEVHPAYFSEWRRLWIFMILDQAFLANPSASIGVVKRFARLDQNGR